MVSIFRSRSAKRADVGGNGIFVIYCFLGFLIGCVLDEDEILRARARDAYMEESGSRDLVCTQLLDIIIGSTAKRLGDNV